MKRLLSILAMLLPALCVADNYLGIFINSNGWGRAQSDQMAAALQVVLADTAPVDFMALPLVRDLPAQKYCYAVWADQEQMRYFKQQSVYAAKADIDQWLSTNGAIKSFVTVFATNAASPLAAEIALGYLRQTNSTVNP